MGYTLPMSSASVLMLMGILTALTPFSGLPISLRTILSVVFGGIIFALGFSSRIQLVNKDDTTSAH